MEFVDNRPNQVKINYKKAFLIFVVFYAFALNVTGQNQYNKFEDLLQVYEFQNTCGIFTELADNNIHHLVISLVDNKAGRNEFADDTVASILKPKNSDCFLKKSPKEKGKKYGIPLDSRFSFEGKMYVLMHGNKYSAVSTHYGCLKIYAEAIINGQAIGSRYQGDPSGTKCF